MILGIGSDLVDNRRLERLVKEFGTRFTDRCFTPAEQAEAAQKKNSAARISFYAKRFAAKEACAKALGTGFRGGIRLNEIGVRNDMAGRPELVLSGKALEQIEKMIHPGKKARLHLTLSDELPYALAFVVIESPD